MVRSLAAMILTLSLPALGADPAAPAFRLGDAAAPLAYEARLAIDPAAATFSGEIRIELRFSRAVPFLWLNADRLDIETAEFRQGERVLKTRVVPGGQDFVGFVAEGEGFAAGDAVATIRYRGALESVDTRGLFRRKEGADWYVVSQFEAISARRAFPCFDEPGWKAPWTLTIDSPVGNEAISNTMPLRVSELAERPGWRRHAFAKTRPLPTYLVAMAVGPFDIVDGGTAGARATPLRYIAARGRGAELRFAKETMPRLLELLEDYFGSPYPFEKLDALAIPATIDFGAMENAGLITYGSNLLLAKPYEETTTFKRHYVVTGIHEIAHQWFGNLVTLAWWDDIWLNEAFATWMERKIVATYRPEWTTGWQSAARRRYALAADRLGNARRVQNPVNAKTEIGGAFDSITYDKGGEVLAMFDAWLGPERFRQGVRDYLARHAWGSATSRDFFVAIAQASGRSESALAAFKAFVEQPGLPLIDVKLACGPRPAIEVAQQRFRALESSAPDMQWTTPACFRYGVGGELHTQCEEIGNARRTIALREARRCPDWVVGNARGAGHSIARYDPGLLGRIAKGLAGIPESDAVALAFDTSLLAGAGLLPMDDALVMADALLRQASVALRHGGVFLLEKQRDPWLTPAQLRKKRDILARRIQPLARELGWVEREGESEGTRDLRVLLLPYAARMEGGESLRPQARELALRWVERRDSVAASMVPAVLETAGRFADEATYARLEAAVIAEADRRGRSQLLGGLVMARDPALRDRAWSLALRADGGAPLLDGREAYLVASRAMQDDDNRAAAFTFVRGQWDALVAKFPKDWPIRVTRPLGALCTPEERAAYVDFFGERAAAFLGGPKQYAEALETIDICIAVRQAARKP